MKRKSMPAITIAVLFVLVSVAVQSAEAQYRRTWMPRDPALELTDEQYARIQEIRLKLEEKSLALQTRWRRISLDLDELEWKGTDRAAVDAKIKELDQVEAELDKMYLDYQDEIRSVLTKEQWEAFGRYGGLGLGPGPGWGPGIGPRWGMRWGGGRGYGWGAGMGRGYRWAPGMGRGYGLGYGRGWGPGLGRGFYCPWFRRW